MKVKYVFTALLGLVMFGCAKEKTDAFLPPQTILSPYSTSGNEVTFAVAPPRNESGTGTVDILTIGDELVANLEQVRGVRCIPMNRTIDAMRQLQLEQVTTTAQARALAGALGADGVLVTTITAYDPYRPSMGMAAALFAKSQTLSSVEQAPVDPRLLTRATTSTNSTIRSANKPLSVISNHLDGRNHQVQADVKTYALGRQRDRSAIEWRRYLQAMPLFVGYSCHQTISDLMNQEHLRIARLPTNETQQASVPESDQ